MDRRAQSGKLALRYALINKPKEHRSQHLTTKQTISIFWSTGICNITKKCILVIDDEHMVSEVIQAHIAKAGYDEISFENPGDAISYFEKEFRNVDGAIIDLTLPGMTGIELARNFLRVKPDLKIILVTGQVATLILPDEKAPFHNIIYKPFFKQDILDAVESVMGKPGSVP